MPQLGFPHILGEFTPQLCVHLFIKSGYTNDDLQFVKDSVIKARDVLRPYKIGLAVIGIDGPDHREEIGIFTNNGPLFVDSTDQYGRAVTSAPGALAARTEVEKKIKWGSDCAVVLFGNATSTRSRGHTNDTSTYNAFCAVDITQTYSTVTMLHEVGHCAGLQHYMARTDLTNPATQDDKNMMAEVPDSKANARDKFNDMELNLLKSAYFMGALD